MTIASQQFANLSKDSQTNLDVIIRFPEVPSAVRTTDGVGYSLAMICGVFNTSSWKMKFKLSIKNWAFS